MNQPRERQYRPAMATATVHHSYDGRSTGSSPRFKGRDHTKNTLCRNVTIYGYCRHEKDGCMYNHDVSNPRNATAPSSQTENNAGVRNNFNVDSPSFTPATPNLPKNNGSPAAKKASFSPNLRAAASAATFVPRTKSQGFPSPRTSARGGPTQSRGGNWGGHEFNVPEFVPQNFIPPEAHASSALADPFNPYADPASYAAMEATPPNPTLNPYIADSASTNQASFFQQAGHVPPLQHHLYAPIGPHRENLLPYQRTAHDFFIAEDLRQDLQRKMDATLQVMLSTSLPAEVEHFHSLVPLDTNSQKTNVTYGYKTWVYKATSSKDGLTYVLRRLEDFRLTSEKTIQPIHIWKQIRNASIVNIHDCFTTRAFNDSSLVIVTDYHPRAKTLAEHQFQPVAGRGPNAFGFSVREDDLWGYLVQLASALKVIHQKGLAARLLSPSKILLTSKGRVRLNGCSILDIAKSSDTTPMEALHIEDMQQLGRLILGLASNTHPMGTNPQAIAKCLATVTSLHSAALKDCIVALISDRPPTIDAFLADISSQVVDFMDKALHLDDDLTSNLSRELENGRIVRLMAKLGFINERPEYNHNGGQPAEAAKWSETGERYYLKLFRDYVFHQVAQDGRPVLDLAHVIACLNKVDAGSDERIALITRDEQNVFVVSYKEIKRGLDSAFNDLVKAQRRA